MKPICSRMLSLALVAGMVAGASAATPSARRTGTLPLTDNASPPFKAVYRWGQGGCLKGLYDAYGPWLNRKTIWAEDFMPTEGWNKIQGEGWQLGTWSNWVHKAEGRRLILSVPLLPGPWDCSGPMQGPGSNPRKPVSLAQGAAGEYNAYFKTLAEHLVAYGLEDAILRLGWEFNGGWYTFRANDEKSAIAFAGYFRTIVETMRTVPGQAFKFCWNPALESWWAYPPEKAWPGDAYVDYIGLDVYDQSWNQDTYPIPKEADENEILRRQKKVWYEKLGNRNAYGLPWWVAFSKQHGNIPLAICEWGVCTRQDGHGGGDNPFFIEQMAKFIFDASNNVAFECYFDVGAPDGDHQLVPDPDGNRPTRFPKAAAKYLECFALPPTSP